jgi:glycosyltransferase involved in cell wall biosynthesis
VKPGVNVYGYVHAESGMGELTRSLVAALRAGGVEYTVIPTTETPSRQQSGFVDHGSGEPVFDVNIIGVNADSMPFFVDRFGYSAFDGRYTICIWAWEVEKFPLWMARSADFVDEVWGISSHTARAIEAEITRPVSVFPLPVRPPRGTSLRRENLGLPEGFLFLFSYDFDSVFRRKNPIAVVQAFKQAFPHAGEAQLVLKSVNGDRHETQLQTLEQAAAGRDDITILDAYFSPEEQQALSCLCDAYVSLHRSEGFGLTMAEAMAAGKPVIATGYSGNMDFMTESNSFPVPFELVEVGSGCYPYPADSRWAEPDIDSAARFMREVREGSAGVNERARRARSDIAALHSPAARSQFVVDRLAHAGKELDRSRHVRKDGLERGGVVPESDSSNHADFSTVAAQISRIEEMIRRGPEVDGASVVPMVVPWFRRLLMRLMRNYHLHQQQVSLEMLELIRDLAAAGPPTSHPEKGGGGVSRGVGDQLASAAEIAESTARECEVSFGEPAEDVARTLRLLAARLRGLAA